jgi:hypothetical protein
MARGAFLVLSEKVNGRGGDGGGDSGNGGSARETLPVVSRCHEASPSLPPSLPLSLSIYLSIHLSIYPSIHLSISLLSPVFDFYYPHDARAGYAPG